VVTALKILIIGAGPAGLSFAALMGGARRRHSITVLERQAADTTPGWGITLRDHALPFLGLDSRIVTESLNGRALRRGADLLVDLPNPPDVHLVTFPRATLIAALADVCRSRQVLLRFGVDAHSLSDDDLGGYDVVVAADGARSTIRQRYAHAFKPTIAEGRNWFTWLGSDASFDKLTVLLSEGDPTLLGWAYRYSPDRSTFIVECTEPTYQRMRFSEKPVTETCAAIGRAFKPGLNGRSILAAASIQWQRYPVLSCERLTHQNVVLIGDASHTTHFSQGFGTMFAFDDALGLHNALEHESRVEEALASYQSTQRLKIAQFQSTAGQSMHWSERLLDSAERGDEAATQELIAARWRNNAVTTSPFGRDATTAT
jgi:anthraniloyl-CoA monooxygenase